MFPCTARCGLLVCINLKQRPEDTPCNLYSFPCEQHIELYSLQLVMILVDHAQTEKVLGGRV